MKTLFYSTRGFEQPYLEVANNHNFEVAFTQESLSSETANQAKGFDIVCIFTQDDASAKVLEALNKNGVKFIAIRAAGYDNVDIPKANELDMAIANVPEYSPYAIAEHAVTLILALNRKIVLANQQVHQQNFTTDNLIGFDLHGKTVGIIGTGKIGSIFIKIMHGFGCRLLAYDIKENADLKEKYGVEYLALSDLCRQSQIISIHTNLNPKTKHIINKNSIELMQPNVMLINTGRGGCVDTADVIEALENKQIAYYGADVYEYEKGLFFNNLSNKELKDDLFKKLITMSNVLITPHQAFATKDALSNIASTTFHNIDCWNNKQHSENELTKISA